MLRYALFVGDRFYPRGGWLDFVGTFASIEEARGSAKEPKDCTDWWLQIADLRTGEMVVEEDDLESEWATRQRAIYWVPGPDQITGAEEALDGPAAPLPTSYG